MSTYTLFNGKLILNRQKNNPSEDALWLACAVSPAPKETILDVGCGNGIVGLSIATHTPKIQLTGLDIDQSSLNQAQENASLNNVPFTCIHTDILDKNLSSQSFDHIVSNPPFHLLEKGFEAKDQHKHHAHGITQEKLQEWVEKLLKLTNPTGTTTIIVHANSVTDLIRNSPARIAYLQTKKGAKPKRAIIQFGANAEERRIKAWETRPRQHCLKDGKSLWDL